VSKPACSPEPTPRFDPAEQAGSILLVMDVSREEAREEARRYVRRKRILYTAVAIWVVLSLMWFAIDMRDDGTESLWFYWPMLGTGIAIAIAAIVFVGIGGIFGAEWERRQTEKYLRRRGGGPGVGG
jgi:hypothetical protein